MCQFMKERDWNSHTKNILFNFRLRQFNSNEWVNKSTRDTAQLASGVIVYISICQTVFLTCAHLRHSHAYGCSPLRSPLTTGESLTYTSCWDHLRSLAGNKEKKITILTMKKKSPLGFASAIFGMHEPIVADIWNTLITVNEFYGRKCEKYYLLNPRIVDPQ